jgi:hypothetical protein
MDPNLTQNTLIIVFLIFFLYNISISDKTIIDLFSQSEYSSYSFNFIFDKSLIEGNDCFEEKNIKITKKSLIFQLFKKLILNLIQTKGTEGFN